MRTGDTISYASYTSGRKATERLADLRGLNRSPASTSSTSSSGTAATALLSLAGQIEVLDRCCLGFVPVPLDQVVVEIWSREPMPPTYSASSGFSDDFAAAR